MTDPSSGPAPAEERYDVVVVGAGIGGIYAVYKLRELGLSVLGVDGAAGFGGVWYHNRYPGARVDVDSLDYSYYFSEELYREWRWSERYATQPELMRYFDHVADRFDLRKDFSFCTWVTGARWDPARQRHLVATDTGRTIATRFLVMATGNLSRSRDVDFPGLESYRGEWVQTSHWPDREVALAGRRVGVVGTGSSGVQTIGAIAPEVGELYVFQRSPNFSVPAHNGPLDEQLWSEIAADVRGHRERLFFGHPGATHLRYGVKPTADYSPEEVVRLVEEQYGRGGHEFAMMFTDQGRDPAANELIAEFVRRKIRSIVHDPEVAEALCPHDHPIGTRRLVLDTGYYESFNLPHVTLVDLKKEPLETVTEAGIRTAAREYDLDLIIFANGFTPFVGCLEAAHITNEHGEKATDGWGRGPRTFLGLMTDGFPNLFFLTGPGSPSVLANMALGNEFHVDWVAGLIGHMRAIGATTVEPTEKAVDEWTDHVQEVARPMLRYWTKNYMVHVNADDGSRSFMPYMGGHHEYARRATEVADGGYPGLTFR
jgi:cation diffusion facilitator CzcD-associated flavoprotein CzcO